MIKPHKLISTIITTIFVTTNIFSLPIYAAICPPYTYNEPTPDIQIAKTSDDINNETILNISDKIKPEKKEQQTYLINFNKILSVGRTEDDTLVDCEAEYGISGMISENKIIAKIYDHTESQSKTSTVFRYIDSRLNVPINLLKEYAVLNLQDPSPGIYQIKTDFENKKSTSIYIYITKSKNIYFCNILSCTPKNMKILQNRRLCFKNMAYIDQTENLDMSLLTYPVENPTEKRPSETALWMAKSNEICNADDSPEYKVYKLYKWCINNIAYDFYRTNELKNRSRANCLNDFSGKYGTYQTKTGVCLDYANIFTIMCRCQGIPTATIGSESKNHVWNAVLINSKWWELDLSNAAKYGIEGYDTEKRTKRKNIKSYAYFFNFTPHRSAKLPSDAVPDKYLCVTR